MLARDHRNLLKALKWVELQLEMLEIVKSTKTTEETFAKTESYFSI
jgi:hypothetical protein